MDKIDGLLITEVLNNRTGEVIPAIDLLASQEEVFLLRNKLEKAIQQKIKYLVCPYCGQNLKIRAFGSFDQRMHFAHLKDSDECPIKTDTHLSKDEILAIKYNGCKESDRHIRMKNRLYEALSLDDRFRDTNLEKVISDINEKKTWKKPDVQSVFNGVRFVFEIQLSTTFLSVIVKRSLFYNDNVIPLIWIFDYFNPADTRFSERDIFYTNNSNAIVFDKECYTRSITDKHLQFRVFYKKWNMDRNHIAFSWVSDIIDFSLLIAKNDTVYFYDVSREKRKLEYHLAKNNLWDYLGKHLHKRCDYYEFNSILNILGDFEMPAINPINKRIAILLIIVFFSIQQGKVYGYKHEKLISIICIIFENHKDFVWLLISFIDKGSFEYRLVAEGSFDKYVEKKKYSKTENIEDNHSLDRYLHFLFPREIQER